MLRQTRVLAVCSALAGAVLATPAKAQFAVTWSAANCGGATTPLSASPYTLQSSIGQPLAGAPVSAGPYGLGVGFLEEGGGRPPPCYANCDHSTVAPVLNVLDFICFQSRFAAQDPYADCDRSNALNVLDFICFQSRFAAGCP
jgi:hypothetical protein